MAGRLGNVWNLPNALTVARVLVIPFFCYLLALATPEGCIWAAAIFGAAAITDFMDGYLARQMGVESRMGKFLDPLADKLIVMAALFVLVDLHWIPAWIAIVVIARELYVNGLRSMAAAEGLVIAAGWAGKYKTAFQLSGLPGLIIHYQYEIDFGIYSGPVRFDEVGAWLFYVSLVFSIISAVTYTMGFYRAVVRVEPA